MNKFLPNNWHLNVQVTVNSSRLERNASHALVNFVGFQMGKPWSCHGFSLLVKWLLVEASSSWKPSSELSASYDV